MRVHVVDPSAYTPPYDHALCSALAKADTQVDLFSSRFAYGAVARADDYVRHELFYRVGLGAPGGRSRTASKLVQHVPDMLRYRCRARSADVVHFQWLPVQYVDRWLLPRGRPLVLTAHDVMPREPRPGQLAAQRRLYARFDAVVVHSADGRRRLVEDLGVEPKRVHVIPHGAFAHLARPGSPSAPKPFLGRSPPSALDSSAAPSPPSAPSPPAPVVLCFGLMRPYKGIDVLLDAWRGEYGEQPIAGAELWIAGLPRMDIAPLRAAAPENVRFDARFVPDAELADYFERADLVVLPYRQADQSGVLFTALAFGKPLLLSDVGGFPELEETGAARIVPAGDAPALGRALRELLADPAKLAEMAANAGAVAAGRYSWEAVARAHLDLYRELLERA